jgi:hypothetical protein
MGFEKTCKPLRLGAEPERELQSWNDNIEMSFKLRNGHRNT